MIVALSALGALAIILGIAGVIYTIASLHPRLERAYSTFNRNIELAERGVEVVMNDQQLREALRETPKAAAQTANRASELTHDMTAIAVRAGDALRTTAQLLGALGPAAEALVPGRALQNATDSLENLAHSAEELSSSTPDLQRELKQLGSRFAELSTLTGRALQPEGESPAMLRTLGETLGDTHRSLDAARLPTEVAAMVIGLSGLSVLFGLGLIGLAITHARVCDALNLLEAARPA